jgi:hypothetical protein
LIRSVKIINQKPNNQAKFCGKIFAEEQDMSVGILETIKEQTKKLSPQEKKLLVDFLIQNGEISGQSDLGLRGENKEEKRRLRDQWMRSEENRQKYGGLYAALDGDKLIATGKNYPETARKAEKSGAPEAVTDFVRPLGYVGEIGGWV